MAQPRDRLERVGRLLACLLDRQGPVGRDELERIFPEYQGESGRRRFEDDKAALRRAGVRLRVVEHLGVVEGYELRWDDYRLAKLDLTPDEQVALALAMGSVDLSTVPWSRLAGTKLGLNNLRGAIGGNQPEGSGNPPGRVGDQADGEIAVGGLAVSALAELPGLEVLPVLQEAVVDRRDIRFGYQRALRHLDPWGLVSKHGRWYVPGFDHERQAPRNFRVDRMDPDSVVLGEPGAFDAPAEVVVADLVPDDALVMAPGDRRTARLRVDWRVARLIEPDVVIDAAIDPGPDPASESASDPAREPASDPAGESASDPAGESVWVPVEVEVSYVPAFVTWVLGFGDLVRVDGPAELREAVVARLAELAV